MGTDLIGKRILVLCDSDDLAKSIAARLNGRMDIIPCTPLSIGRKDIRRRVGYLDMIVLVASLPDSEPAAMLFEASLLERMGHTPLLVVSHRHCHSEAGDQVYNLRFPYDESALCDRIESILGDNGAAAHS
jgi:hypothetical protein